MENKEHRFRVVAIEIEEKYGYKHNLVYDNMSCGYDYNTATQLADQLWNLPRNIVAVSIKRMGVMV